MSLQKLIEKIRANLNSGSFGEIEQLCEAADELYNFALNELDHAPAKIQFGAIRLIEKVDAICENKG